MSKGLFSRIESDRYLDDQSSLMDVFNAAIIDRAIGFQASPLEEIGHAVARKTTKKGLSGLFDLLLNVMLTVLYALNVAFHKIFIVRCFFISSDCYLLLCFHVVSLFISRVKTLKL